VSPPKGAAGPRSVVRGRLGVLGGTFDPIHFGHLAIGEAAREELGCERVLFVPARRPPHRPDRPIAAAADRAAMVELAIAANPSFALSRLELDRDGPSYTIDTLRALAQSTADLWFILSAEAFADFLEWHDPGAILAVCRLAVVPREGHPDPDLGPVRAALGGAALDRISILDGPRLRLAATEVRNRAARRLSVRYLVPDAVATYIEDHRLYRGTDRIGDPNEPQSEALVAPRRPAPGGTPAP
jgi:nicotinate-nucleotide adenylyltransferase